MSKDLRQFIGMLEEEWPEEIIRVEGGPFAPAEGECQKKYQQKCSMI